MKKIAILSGKFSIGLVSLLEAYYELVLCAGYYPLFIINKQYREYIIEYKNIYEIKEIENLIVDVLIIFNISIYDISIIKKLKKSNSKVKIIFIYHEPWRGCIKEFKRQKNIKNFIKTCGRKFLSNKILKRSDEVWLPSINGEKEYLKIDINFNNNYFRYPLIFKDELVNTIDLQEKKYFSYIATVDESRRFKEFLSFIKYYNKKNDKIKFLIATKSNIDSYLDEELKSMMARGILKIKHARDLSNSEINAAYNKSWCVWLLYESSTQSGVLCKSFMFGTPVIASNIEAFREFLNKNNSVVIKNYNDMNEIINSANFIKDKLDLLSKNARESFIKEFYFYNKKEVFKERIEYIMEKEK